MIQFLVVERLRQRVPEMSEIEIHALGHDSYELLKDLNIIIFGSHSGDESVSGDQCVIGDVVTRGEVEKNSDT